MPRDPDCVFCKIVAGDIPSAIVAKTDAYLAFLDVGPLADGHLLIVPREHYALLTDLPESTAAEIGGALPRLGRALLQVTKAEGYNVLVNCGTVSGQVVPHVHYHLIPRVPGDQLGYRWNAGSYDAGRQEELVTLYASALSASARH